MKHVFSGERRELSLSYDTYQYVPLLRSLEILLNDPIQNEVDQLLVEFIQTA